MEKFTTLLTLEESRWEYDYNNLREEETDDNYPKNTQEMLDFRISMGSLDLLSHLIKKTVPQVWNA